MECIHTEGRLPGSPQTSDDDLANNLIFTVFHVSIERYARRSEIAMANRLVPDDGSGREDQHQHQGEPQPHYHSEDESTTAESMNRLADEEQQASEDISQTRIEPNTSDRESGALDSRSEEKMESTASTVIQRASCLLLRLEQEVEDSQIKAKERRRRATTNVNALSSLELAEKESTQRREPWILQAGPPRCMWTRMTFALPPSLMRANGSAPRMAVTTPGAYYMGDNENDQDEGEDSIIDDSYQLSSGNNSHRSLEFVLEAQLVEDEEPDVELKNARAELRDPRTALEQLHSVLARTVDAQVVEPVEDASEQQRKRRRRRFVAASGLVVVCIIVVTLGVTLRSGKGGSNEGGANVLLTNKQLVEAVREYLFNPRSTSEVAQKYGWPIRNWDVSRISDFSRVCADPRFDEDVGSWNVSKGTTFDGMFTGAFDFNKDLSKWDVSRGTSFRGMFYQAAKFDQDISSWNVARVS